MALEKTLYKLAIGIVLARIIGVLTGRRGRKAQTATARHDSIEDILDEMSGKASSGPVRDDGQTRRRRKG